MKETLIQIPIHHRNQQINEVFNNDIDYYIRLNFGW